ncbi:MAG: P-loop NTPase [Gaiellales bacterium]
MGQPETPAVRDHLRVLRRRKWILIATTVLTTAVAVGLSLRSPAVYEASAEVLLRYDNLAASITGLAESSRVNQDAVRVTETQAALASTPTVAGRALELSGVSGMTPDELLDATTISAGADTDVLTFSVESGDPETSETLASAYAHAYTDYRQELDTQAIVQAREEVEGRIAELETTGQDDTALYESLVEKAGLLSTLETLQTQNASVIREADGAVRVQPKPVRNGLLAAALGALLGIALAFLFEALDTRVRSAEELRAALRLPLLARIPDQPSRRGSGTGLVTLDAPGSAGAEAFRVLRTSLEFVNLERGARTIMVTSALPGEGKSTTAANLAVTLARAGRHVALIDLDLRRPAVNTLFDFDREPGLTDVVLGRRTLEETRMAYVLPGTSGQRTTNGNGGASPGAKVLLEVLATGPLPPDPGEFIMTGAIANVLEQLRERASLVLVDAPPLLGVGDALALSSMVDGLLLVTRPHALRRPMLDELRRVLDTCPAAKLGFVTLGQEESEAFDYTSYYDYRSDGRERMEQAGRSGAR